MRKFMNIFAAALIMLAAVSCEKNEVLPDSTEGKVVTLNVSINNGGTKTYLGQGEGDPIQYPVYWREGDAIAVINNGKLFKFVVEEAGKTQSKIELSTFENCGYEVSDFDETEPVQAFYPYDGVTYEPSTGAINYTVPATQTYTTAVDGGFTCSTFGNGASPMAAYRAAGATNSALIFDNLFGVLKLKLKGTEKVFGIEIISDDNLNGDAELTITELLKSISFPSENAESSDKKVTLICNDGVSLSSDTPTDFLVALPANATDLRVLIHTISGSYSKDIPSLNTNAEPINSISAGQILVMPQLILGTDITPITYMENGANLGNGIAIPTSDGTFTIWAPVNCGYDVNNFRWGKLYQWGRKEGQGYWRETDSANDAIKPTTDDGPVSWENYVKGDFSDVFFKVTDETGDWLSPQNADLWGNGKRTEYDPCPDGWRVPTIEELEGLTENSQHRGANYDYWFSGKNQCNSSYPRICLQYRTGRHDYNSDEGTNRGGNQGYYWSSTTDGNKSKYISISKGLSSPYPIWLKVYSTQRANAYVIRCVMDDPQYQPMLSSN